MRRIGLSLLEVVIVITLMGILSAIIVPNFINTSEKSKLKADISSAIIIQNAKDLYEIENGDIGKTVVNNIIEELYQKKYLKQGTYTSQSQNSFFVIEDEIIKINITNNSKKDELYNEIEEQLQGYVVK